MRGRSHVAVATGRSSHPARWKPPLSPSCRWRWPYVAENEKTVTVGVCDMSWLVSCLQGIRSDRIYVCMYVHKAEQQPVR